MGIKELTPTIVNDFVKKIIVHAPDKSSGKRIQEIDIYYNAVGVIDIPTDEELEVLKAEHETLKQKEHQSA